MYYIWICVVNKTNRKRISAEKSDVKYTAIRDYEQNHKPINKASSITVYKLSVALENNVCNYTKYLVQLKIGESNA